jgi:hypothetical protein
MPPAIKSMSLGDIFDRLFKLLGTTFRRNLILTVIIIVPSSIIFAYGLDSFFGNIAEFARTHSESDLDNLENWGMLFSGMASFGLTWLIFMLGYLAATLGVTIIACNEMNGRKVTWNEALSLTMGIRFGRLLGQQLLLILAISATFFFPYFLLILDSNDGPNALSGIAVLMIFASFFIVIFLWIKWVFAIPAIAWEETGVYGAFQRSWQLVKYHWWRTFGILLLLSIVIQFALSIVTTPISMFAFWDFYARYFEMIGSLGGEQISPEEVFGLFDTMGLGIGFASGLSTVLSLLIMPLIPVVMYFDLRARHGEFAEQTPPEASEGEIGNVESE